MRDGERGSDDIRIQTPCLKTWDELEGGAQRRFCSECSLHVHDSSALTRSQARALIDGATGRVCMRIVKDRDGAPLYLDSAPPSGPGPIRALPRAAGWILAAGAGLLSACRDESPAPAPTDPSSGQPQGAVPACDPDETVGLVAPDFEILGEAVAVEPLPAAHPDELGDVAVALPDGEGECEQGQGPAPAHEVMGRVAAPPAEVPLDPVD